MTPTKPELAQHQATVLDQTDKLSNQIRQVSFAGFAIIWAFKLPLPKTAELTSSLSLKSVLHQDLYIAFWFFTLVLSLDLAQYLFGALSGIALIKDQESKAGIGLRLITYLLLACKFLSCVGGYLYLFFYIA